MWKTERYGSHCSNTAVMKSSFLRLPAAVKVIEVVLG